MSVHLYTKQFFSFWKNHLELLIRRFSSGFFFFEFAHLSDIVEVPVADSLLFRQLANLIEQNVQLELVLQEGEATVAERLPANSDTVTRRVPHGRCSQWAVDDHLRQLLRVAQEGRLQEIDTVSR